MNPQGGRDNGFSCGSGKGGNSCHLAIPQGGSDKVFSCGTGTVGEGRCMIMEVTEPQSNYDLNSQAQNFNMSSTSVISAREPDPKQLVSSYGEGHDSCHLANPECGRDKGFSCRTGKGYDSCNLANSLCGRDKGFSCRTGKRYDSCHLANPQGKIDNGFSCGTRKRHDSCHLANGNVQSTSPVLAHNNSPLMANNWR